MALIFKRPRFDPLAVKLRQLASGVVRQAAAGAIRDTIEEQIDRRFNERADPDGVPWAPRKEPTGAWPLLEKTGRMRNDYHVAATTTGVSVTNNRPYAKVHQTGRGNMPARPVLPPDGKLPEEWREEIDAAIKAELERIK